VLTKIKQKTVGAITYGAKANFGLKPKIKQKTEGYSWLCFSTSSAKT
jgi:hypothetical protein